jgi:Calponin homology (CH) domain
MLWLQFIQTRLKLTLPEDVMESLQDGMEQNNIVLRQKKLTVGPCFSGVVLCHLVNNIRPRSVISIHVPPNTQSGILKLTPAKSRRNVENFLDACRRLGVPDVSFFNPYLPNTLLSICFVGILPWLNL